MKQLHLLLGDNIQKGQKYFGNGKERTIQSEDRLFRATFGCGDIVVRTLWNKLVETGYLPSGGALDHLLWTLMLLRTYSN